MPPYEFLELHKRASMRLLRSRLELIHIIHSSEIKKLARKYSSAIRSLAARIGARHFGGGIKWGTLKKFFGAPKMKRVSRDDRPTRDPRDSGNR
jgi:hypothetical protein